MSNIKNKVTELSINERVRLIYKAIAEYGITNNNQDTMEVVGEWLDDVLSENFLIELAETA